MEVVCERVPSRISTQRRRGGSVLSIRRRESRRSIGLHSRDRFHHEAHEGHEESGIPTLHDFHVLHGGSLQGKVLHAVEPSPPVVWSETSAASATSVVNLAFRATPGSSPTRELALHLVGERHQLQGWCDLPGGSTRLS